MRKHSYEGPEADITNPAEGSPMCLPGFWATTQACPEPGRRGRPYKCSRNWTTTRAWHWFTALDISRL